MDADFAQTEHFIAARKKILFAIVIGYLFYYCARQNFGFAILDIQRALHLHATDIGIISAGFLFFYGVGQAINGGLGDQFSARYLVTLGALLSVLFNFIVSFAHGFWLLFIPWCIVGYAQSLGFAPSSKMIANWWSEKERGKIFGIYLAVSGLASILAYALCIEISTRMTWEWLFRLPVLPLLLSGFLFFYLARDKPEDLGFTLHGLTSKIDHSLDADSHASNQRDNIEPTKQHTNRYLYVIKHFHFQLAAMAMGFCSIARYTLMIWIPVTYMQSNHHQVNTDYRMLGLPLGMTIGAIGAGLISDKLFQADRIIPTVIFMLMATVLSLTIYFIPLQSSLGIFICLL